MNSVNKSLLLLFSLLPFFAFTQDTIPDNAERVKYFHSNGVKSSSGYLVDGEPDGYWRTYYASGQLKSEGNRVNKQLNGAWKFYDQLGIKYLVINYKEGKKWGFRKNYKDQELVSAEWFTNDVRDSLSYYFYPDSVLKRQIPFKEGEERGTGYEFSKDGTIITLLIYRSGVLVRNEKINRTDDLGRKQGLFKEFFPDGVLKMEGTYLNDLKHGYFKYYYEDGTLKKTEKYENGVLIESPETAKIRFRQEFYPDGSLMSEGTFRKGVKDGVYKEFDENGELITSGLFAMGKLLAKGKYDELGRRQGPWIGFYPDGTPMWEGSYKDDEEVGTWKYYFRDGKLEQVGSYRVGKPSGIWKWYYPNGELRKEEDWLRGYRDGTVLEYDSLGNILVRGNYREDLPDGRWQVTINDFKAVGNYRDGLENGMWKFYYDGNKPMYQGAFVDGLPNGKHISYHYNGREKEIGTYDYGFKVGTWMRYDENGERILSITYNKGEEVGYDGVQVSELELKEPVN